MPEIAVAFSEKNQTNTKKWRGISCRAPVVAPEND